MKSPSFVSVWLVGFAIAIQLLLMTPADAKFMTGHLKTASNFQFLDRFCFQPNEKGTLRYEFKYRAEYCCYKLLMFNDEPGQWPYIRENGHQMSCGQKKEVIPGTYNAKLTLKDPYNGCKRFNYSDGIQWMHCVGGRSFKTVRARWWFLVMSNCYSEDGIDIQFNITMTNGVKLWDKHFSADERYILETDMTFLFVYFAMLVITAHFTKILSERKLLHTTYKLFVWSMMAEFCSLLFLTIALGRYGSTGIPHPKLEMFANFIGAAGILIFILMIILLSKGFTVTRGTLSTSGSAKIGIFMTLYTITYIILYIYEETAFDPRDVLYKYESVAGHGLIGLAFFGFLWTYYAIFFSVKHYPEKTSFYVPFGVIFTLWWLATPVTIFICNYAIEAWVRAKVVNGIERAVICGGHVFFLLLTRPNAANRNFPFHIKTTQIAAMKCDDSDAYSGTPGCVLRGEVPPGVNVSFNDLFITDMTPREKYAVDQEKQQAE